MYGEDVYQFDTTVPNRVAIRDHEHDFAADTDPDVQKTFELLAEEFIKRLPSYSRHPDDRKPKPKTIEGM